MRHIVPNCPNFVLVFFVGGMVAICLTWISTIHPAIADRHEGRVDQSMSLQEDTKMDKKYTEVEARNLKKVKDSFEAWRNRSGSPYQLLSENVSWTIVGNSLASKEYKSRKAFIDEVITPFNARMSKPLVPSIRSIYADGDTVIVLFDAQGMAADGKPYTNTYSWFLTLREGEIEKAVAFFDSIKFNDLWTRVPAAPK